MKFKHYKGGEYELVTLATDEATNEPLVVYKALSDGTVWSRPAKVFFGRAFVDGGGAINRFSLVLPAGQALSCDNGCEYPKLTVESFEFSREETLAGELLSSRCKPKWQCRCGAEIGVYHEIDGSVASLEESTPPKLSCEDLAHLVEGMEVSVDVSTGEHDAGSRVFGTITEAMDHPGAKHDVMLLVQDKIERNFDPVAPLPPRVVDQLIQSAGVSTFHPDGDQGQKLHALVQATVVEAHARRPA